MNSLLPIIADLLAISTLLSDIAIIIVVFVFILPQLKRFRKTLLKYSVYAIPVSFLIVLSSIAGSLFFSEIASFEACLLCWYQRMFIYPQIFLFATAIYLKQDDIVKYSIVLSTVGALLAAYQYIGQIIYSPITPCSALGLSASCSQSYIMKFGYITIPMMSLTVFLLLIIINLLYLKRKKCRKKKC